MFHSDYTGATLHPTGLLAAKGVTCVWLFTQQRVVPERQVKHSPQTLAAPGKGGDVVQVQPFNDRPLRKPQILDSSCERIASVIQLYNLIVAVI